MGRGTKLATASAVLLLGATVAMLDRLPSSPPKTSKPAAPAEPVLGPWTAPEKQPIPPPAPPVAEQTPPAPVSHPQAMIGPSLDPDRPPPRLPQAYPRPDEASSGNLVAVRHAGRRPTSGDDRPEPYQIHKVAEGDTLRRLAQRYLGSADREMEIYELNRDLLPAPDVLPIGNELKIPPRDAPPNATSRERPPHGLVPVGR